MQWKSGTWQVLGALDFMFAESHVEPFMCSMVLYYH